MKATIPNLLTAGNLIGGILAIIFSLTGKLEWAPYCIFISAFLDFFDGFAARLLKVQSELGKQLDSLADMVTFGVAPGVIVYVLLDLKNIAMHDSILFNHLNGEIMNLMHGNSSSMNLVSGSEILENNQKTILEGNSSFWNLFYQIIPFIALIISVMSMFRLAKFNLDTRQTNSFIGVPTPANTLFFASLPLILIQFSDTEIGWQSSISTIILNPWFLIISSIIMSYLLIAELPLFALKFKSFGWKGNEIRYIFLTLAVVMLATLHWLALPLIIILYILLSLIQNLRRNEKIQS